MSQSFYKHSVIPDKIVEKKLGRKHLKILPKEPFHTRVGNSKGKPSQRGRELLSHFAAGFWSLKCFMGQRLPAELGLLYNEAEQRRGLAGGWGEPSNTSAPIKISGWNSL
ncbi:unnamed protein product [Gadus morhua 'NCC']